MEKEESSTNKKQLEINEMQKMLIRERIRIMVHEP